ncbi:MAG: hypothetical protein KGL04_04695 [Elusimicrobia bacterium]|nr:hypothetical protein [Elusimicrobiota bacterium]MDE2313456.1 hypothetical protein [Elusimicrobiota bacterium]
MSENQPPKLSFSGRRLAAGSAVLTIIFLFAVGYRFIRRFAPPQPVQISALWQNRKDWMGARVRCTGTLLVFSRRTAQRYFVLDQDSYRLQILGIPRKELEPWVGRKVLVSGRFEFKENLGMYLLASRIGPAGGL